MCKWEVPSKREIPEEHTPQTGSTHENAACLSGQSQPWPLPHHDKPGRQLSQLQAVPSLPPSRLPLRMLSLVGTPNSHLSRHGARSSHRSMSGSSSSSGVRSWEERKWVWSLSATKKLPSITVPSPWNEFSHLIFTKVSCARTITPSMYSHRSSGSQRVWDLPKITQLFSHPSRQLRLCPISLEHTGGARLGKLMSLGLRTLTPLPAPWERT